MGNSESSSHSTGGETELLWKQDPEKVALASSMRKKFPEANLDDRKMTTLFQFDNAIHKTGHADEDGRRMTEVLILISIREASLLNLWNPQYPETKSLGQREGPLRPGNTSMGALQQNEEFGQRDDVKHWTKKLSPEARMEVEEAALRATRVLYKLYKSKGNWQQKPLPDVCQKLQAPAEPDHYNDPLAIRIATYFAQARFPDQESMMSNPGYKKDIEKDEKWNHGRSDSVPEPDNIPSVMFGDNGNIPVFRNGHGEQTPASQPRYFINPLAPPKDMISVFGGSAEPLSTHTDQLNPALESSSTFDSRFTIYPSLRIPPSELETFSTPYFPEIKSKLDSLRTHSNFGLNDGPNHLGSTESSSTGIGGEFLGSQKSSKHSSFSRSRLVFSPGAGFWTTPYGYD